MLGVVGDVKALTNGPTQPEFTSFEPVDVTDLVNLPTGNFTYVLPLGEVKGPNGVGYPVVLSYHAGIQNEQEASWVGLGWTLNAGAINRALRGTPDDVASGDIRSYMYDKGDNGWGFNIGGGWGPVSATVGWSEEGFGGITSFGLNYNLGVASVGVTIDPVAGAAHIGISGGVNMGSVSASVNVGVSLGTTGFTPYASIGLSVAGGLASFSLSSSGQTGYSIAGASAASSSFSQGGLTQWSSGFSLTIPLPYGLRLDFGYNSWGWYYNELAFGTMYGFLYHSSGVRKKVETYNPLIAQFMADKTEWDYAMQEENVNPPSPPTRDMNIRRNIDKQEGVNTPFYSVFRDDWNTEVNSDGVSHKFYDEELASLDKMSFSPADLYNITGQGISGTFKPVPYKSPITYVHQEEKFDGIYGEFVDGKIEPGTEFNTTPQVFNNYFQDGIVFKMLGEAALNLIDYPGDEFDFSTSGIHNAYQNIDIDAVTSKVKKVTGTRIEPIFGLDEEFPDRISGFVITDMEGKSYYYMDAVYNLEQIGFSAKNTEMGLPDDDFVYNYKSSKFSYRDEICAYPTTWLLTAVTGPDYIKRRWDDEWTSIKEIMRPHQGDWGYWVSLRYKYGRDIIFDKESRLPVLDKSDKAGYRDKASYIWRDPFHVNISNQSQNSDNLMYSAQTGKKEITYLKSIETPSEVAYFRTSPRLDAVGLDSTDYPDFSSFTVKPEHMHNYCTESEYTNHWCKKWITPVPTDDISGLDDYTDFMQIKIPSSLFEVNPELFEKNSYGVAKLFTLYFTAPIKAKRDGEDNPVRLIYSAGYKKTKTHVLWDPYGWDRDGNGKPVKTGDSKKPDPSETENRVLDFLKQADDDGYVHMKEMQCEPGAAESPWIKFAKCFFFETTDYGDSITFYVVGYEFETYIWGKDRIVRTAGKLSPRYWLETANGHKNLRLMVIKDIRPLPSVYVQNTRRIHPFYLTTKYQKKLDEIAWYSKANFPYINPLFDPGEEGSKEDFSWWDDNAPYPQSYKRVQLRYNYELAKNTANSISEHTKVLGEGGRLTLKEVTFQGGPEDQSVSMPPYMFTYEGVNKEYKGYTKNNIPLHDKWGYRLSEIEEPEDSDAPFTSIRDVYSDPKTGIAWNLKKILLPSCGSIEMEFERDYQYSILGMLHKLRTWNRGFEYEQSRSTVATKSNTWYASYKDNGNYPVTWKPGSGVLRYFIHDFDPEETFMEILETSSDEEPPEAGDYFFVYQRARYWRKPSGQNKYDNGQTHLIELLHNLFLGVKKCFFLSINSIFFMLILIMQQV